MRSLMKLVKEKDPILSKDLVSVLATLWWVCYCLTAVSQVKKGVEPTFFGFRWITLLLSQEFLLPGIGICGSGSGVCVMSPQTGLSCFRGDQNLGLPVV